MKKTLLAALAALALMGASAPASAGDGHRHNRHGNSSDYHGQKHHRHFSNHPYGTRIVINPSWVTGTRYYTVARPVYYSPFPVYHTHRHVRGCGHW
jgi:hypothetical protein